MTGRGATHFFQPWSSQGDEPTIRIDRARGVEFWDDTGKRYLDFASQLVNMNLGHQHPRLVAAVRDQADRMCFVAPTIGNDVRNEAARLIAELKRGGPNTVLFTTGGAEANEHAVRLARLHTGRHKVLAAYRSYHGATAGAITLTGDPRRWPAEPGMPGVVHYWGPYLYRSVFHADSPSEEAARALRHLREVVTMEGPDTIAALVLEPVVGTNGVLVPPDGYLRGVRELCDEFGILLIADEVMAGFGRCGEWFAIDRWNVDPDLITFAKGVNSGYVPLGGVIVSAEVTATFREISYPGGSTYSGHPLGCAAAVASIAVFREENVLGYARWLGDEVIGPRLQKLATRHPSVGEVRGLGVLWAIELVRDWCSRTPLVPFNARGRDAEPMRAVAAASHSRGLWPFFTANRVHIAPPCTTNASEIEEGLEILDHVLEVSDGFCAS